MNLRQKSIGIIGATLAGLIIFLYILLRTIVMDSFITLEKEDVKHSVEQTKNILQKETVAINNFVTDWAEWDATYEFLTDNNNKYVTDNLTDTTFLQQRFSNITYFNVNGDIVYSKGFNLIRKAEERVTENFKIYFSPGSPGFEKLLALQPETSLTGVIRLPEGPMLIAVRPILPTSRQGKSKGVMLAGRYLDDAEVGMLSAAADLNLELTDIYKPPATDNYRKAREALLAKDEVFVQANNEQTNYGFGLIRDVNGEPALMIKVSMPREIYGQGIISMKYFLGSLVGTGVLFLVLVLLLLEKLVLSRLAKLDNTVKGIRSTEDMSKRIDLPGKDELSSLATAINEMLAGVQTAQVELGISEGKNEAILAAIPDSMIVLDQDGTIVDVKEGKDLIFFLAIQEQIQKNVSEITSEEFTLLIMKNVSMALKKKKMQLFEYQAVINGTEICQEYRLVRVNHNQVLVMIKDISRRRKMEKKLEVARQNTEEKNKEISLLLQELGESMAVVTNLLNNTGQGILTFGFDCIIAPEYSMECKKIFAGEIAGQNFITLALFEEEEAKLVSGVISDVLQISNTARQNVFLSLLADRLVIREQIFAVQYKVISASEELKDQKIMVILTNITKQIALQLQVDEERELQNIIVKVIEQHSVFIEFTKEFKGFLTSIGGRNLNCQEFEKMKKDELYRKIHTFKGLFAQFGFKQLALQLHELETYIAEEDSMEKILENVKKVWKVVLEEKFNLEWMRLLKILGEGFLESENHIHIDVNRLVNLEKTLATMLPDDEAQGIVKELKSWRYKNIACLLMNYKNYVVELGQRMDKQVSYVAVEGPIVLVDMDYYQEFLQSLGHVFRNMVDHGIEEPEERIMLGKEEYGQITFAISLIGKELCIEISDDGRGIDVGVIGQKAIEKGIVPQEKIASMEEQSIMELIFSAGLSTKDNITSISGRGIGLDVVKSIVEKMGGSVMVRSQVGVGTTFTFYLGPQYIVKENLIAL